MERGRREEENPKLVDPRMEEPQTFALLGKWDYFLNYFRQKAAADDLIKPFNLAGNTAIHIAARSDNPDLLRKLLDMLEKASIDHRREALREVNAHKNTLLHQVALCEEVEMVDLVLKYEKDKNLAKPDDENLLELRNDLGETPVYRAAKYGRLRMLKRMAQHVENMEPHFHRTSDFTSILHIAIIGQHFDVAKWLSKKEGIEKVASAYEGIKEKGLSCLQLLSRMPSAFKSYNSQAGFVHNLIYVCLPNKGYDEEEDDDDGFIRENGDIESEKGDIESGKNKAKKTISPSLAVSPIIYYAIWKLVAKEWDSVKEIWKRKKKNKQAKEVADFLVSIDNSWTETKHGSPRREVVLPVIQPKNVAATRKACLEPLRCKNYTPLLLAASTGIIEIVEKIIESHPDAVSHVSQHDEENVLHVAVKHRQKNIYKHLKEYKVLKGLAFHIATDNRTLLHQVARMDYYCDGGNHPGVVFQLQEELRWFERVKKIVPCHYQLFCNKDNLTARELFDLEHSEMLKEAREWIKGTAQSCSAASVLVATVVFAAGYSVPGGTNELGIPNLLNFPLFQFFTVMDVVGQASSLVSVMLFLSILTSPFQMQEFYKSLPRKLTMGFTFLFISLISTVLAFVSTILLTTGTGEDEKWRSRLTYSITFVPVTLFGLTQFPIMMAVKYGMKRVWKNLKKMVPKDMITKMSTKPTCKRDYSKYL
ncbi:uncharacterized protein LOC114722684 [Neltuma alba]|uniref:uncharacterized protein LOC114722684 n=1 Tax=Neltuma alba TaxID=207710 RepID=UPI0010A2C363|nr:uncharacterized protein LOC114722684 [Prosopis alba]